MSATKSRTALEFSVQKLVQGLKDRGSKFKGTFWTFTFVEAHDADQVSSPWRAAMRELKRKIPNFGGVRVYEMHPGGHGVHIHAIIPSYIRVELVRAIMQKFGFGRIHVVALNGNAEQIGRYLAKYFSKAKRRVEFFRKRLWACFGAYDGVKVKDVVIRTHFTEWFKKMRALKDISEDECAHALTKFMRYRDNQKIYRSERLNEEEKYDRWRKIRITVDFRNMYRSHFRFMCACKAIWDLYRPFVIEPEAHEYNSQSNLALI